MSAIPASVPKALAAKVLHWDDERQQGNSLILSLRPGWRFPATECHTQGVDTVKEAIEALRDAKPCLCNECTKELPSVTEHTASNTHGATNMTTSRKSEQTLTDESRIKAVKDYALKMYEKGWDIVIETMTDKDILEVVKKCLTVQGCKYAMSRHIGPYNEVRSDVQATAF